MWSFYRHYNDLTSPITSIINRNKDVFFDRPSTRRSRNCVHRNYVHFMRAERERRTPTSFTAV